MSEDHDHEGCASGDEFVILPSPEGSRRVMRHRADHSIQFGTVLDIPEGKPIPPGAEYVHAESLGDGRYAVRESITIGPAQVATKQYRDGWDRTFKRDLN